MSKTIEIKKISRGASIAFPYAYKSEFREQFPRAKWKPDDKVWTVGSASVPRLKQFAVLLEEQHKTRLEREEREMTYDEIESLRNRLVATEREVRATRKSVEDLEAARADMAETKAQLDARREELFAIRARRDEVAAAVEAERQAIHAMVSCVVDIDEIEAIRSEMRKQIKLASANANTKYDSAADRLVEIRKRLNHAGIECDAIDLALSANRNRPTRDYDNLLGPLDFVVV